MCLVLKNLSKVVPTFAAAQIDRLPHTARAKFEKSGWIRCLVVENDDCSRSRHEKLANPQRLVGPKGGWGNQDYRRIRSDAMKNVGQRSSVN